MMTFNSIEEWRDYCFDTHNAYIKNQHFKKWITKKEIHIFNLSSLRKKDINYIKLGIGDAVKIARLHFKIHFNDDDNIKEIINLKNKKINSNKLLKMIIQERKKNRKEHANVFVFNTPIKSSDSIIQDGEALTYVPEGMIMFTFSADKKYSNKFLRCRAKHEALHLLGLNFHHEDTKVKGYKYDMKCNMNYNAPTMNLCRKCKDAVVYFWKGIEYATKKQFIKS